MKIEAIALAGLKGFKVQLVFGASHVSIWSFGVCFMLFVMVAPLLARVFMNAWKPRLIKLIQGINRRIWAYRSENMQGSAVSAIPPSERR
jgi:hypothetical protein